MESLQPLFSIIFAVAKMGAVVVIAVQIYEGTQILAASGQRQKGLKLLASGIFIMVFWAAASIYVSRSLDNFNNPPDQPALAELPTNFGLDCCSPEVREENSRNYASIAFVNSGKLLKYFDRSAGWQQYCPTPKDIESRDESIMIKARIELTSKGVFQSALEWLGIGIIAAFMGWFSGRKQCSPGV